METYILAFMLALAPGRRVEILRPMVKAVALATSRREEAAALITIQFKETSLHLRTIYPFGLTCCFNEARRMAYQRHIQAYLNNYSSSEAEADLIEDLRWAAAKTLQIYKRGEHLCHGAEGAYWFFNTGECPTGQPPAASRSVARARWFRGQHYARESLAVMERGHTKSRQRLAAN